MSNSLSGYLVPNLYNPESYFNLDIGIGRLQNRGGAKMITLSSAMMRGLYMGLKKETGPAWTLILKSCGDSWGDRYVARMFDEAEEFYGEKIKDMKMSRFSAILKEVLAIHGWGVIDVDYAKLVNGVIVVTVENPPMSVALKDVDEVSADILFAGILRAAFTRISNHQLDCYQTERTLGQMPRSKFIIALPSRMESVPELLEKKTSHAKILESVVNTAA